MAEMKDLEKVTRSIADAIRHYDGGDVEFHSTNTADAAEGLIYLEGDNASVTLKVVEFEFEED